MGAIAAKSVRGAWRGPDRDRVLIRDGRTMQPTPLCCLWRQFQSRVLRPQCTSHACSPPRSRGCTARGRRCWRRRRMCRWSRSASRAPIGSPIALHATHQVDGAVRPCGGTRAPAVSTRPRRCTPPEVLPLASPMRGRTRRTKSRRTWTSTRLWRLGVRADFGRREARRPGQESALAMAPRWAASLMQRAVVGARGARVGLCVLPLPPPRPQMRWPTRSTAPADAPAGYTESCTCLHCITSRLSRVS